MKRSLAEHPESLTWRRVTMPGLDVAWVGMNVPVIDTGGRPWVWEVVTPTQYNASSRLQDDLMVLPVAHDTVVAEVNHRDHSGPIMRMQVPVTHAPDAISLPAEPAGPWSVHLETGWTIQALGSAAQCWIDRESPGTARLETLNHRFRPISATSCTLLLTSSLLPLTVCLHSILMTQPQLLPFCRSFTMRSRRTASSLCSNSSRR